MFYAKVKEHKIIFNRKRTKGRLAVAVTINNDEVKLVLKKLDSVQLELLRLRAMLLPEEEVSEEEKKKLEAARNEIAKGHKISLNDLVKELC